ncbi:deleted in malignant brain tumors 1 protein-like [Boleophthalmus pectinirostris]|uniref:deleted in malignant brain tumors 1 protein-like n=1 Tax=Boleophthalmus pectinirostris TaxID=150288 RepID=UPI00242A4A20|nr:deleted in malignant brain tumors 1 protein-like [Boleophthalmus pectinirostris]
MFLRVLLLSLWCWDSVQLVSGSGLCSGSVQIWDRSWTGVCDGDLDQRGAEVLCRELGCGAPSLLQGALSPLGQTFHCEGHESALMDCPRSNSRTCSSGATVHLICSEPIRLVGGASRCSGTVEVKHRGEWRRMYVPSTRWDQEDTAAVCRDLDCGSAVYGEQRGGFPWTGVWEVSTDCVRKSSVRECSTGSSSTSFGLEVKCSDSVRLVSGSGLCSGSVQIWDGSWTGVCDGDLDQRGAEVLCRELGLWGSFSLLQGALSPLGQMFHCEGHESALMDCPRSNSSTCSSGATVNLTCSEPIRLVGGANRCSGTVEVKLGGEWRRVSQLYRLWDQEDTTVVCRDLNCGSAVRGESRDDFPQSPVWEITSDCVRKSSVRRCVIGSSSSSSLGVDVKCSEAVSGRGSNRDLAPVWTSVRKKHKLIQSRFVLIQTWFSDMFLRVLLLSLWCWGVLCAGVQGENDSPGELRLVGGASRCSGALEVKHEGEWRKVFDRKSLWGHEATAVVCRDLDCGSALYGEKKFEFSSRPVWLVSSDCVKKSSVRECVSGFYSFSFWHVEVNCSESVRLVSGSSLCSGSVQIWNGSWTGVCDGDLDQRGAEVLCRELDCGAPSLLQGALSPLGQTFHCEGHESALMDCPRSNSRTCSSGATVNLTCSEPLRLVGGASRCSGTLEVKHRGDWGRVYEPFIQWDQESTAAVCRDLDCGSAVYGGYREDFPESPVWSFYPDCVKKSSVRGCVFRLSSSPYGLEVKCSDSVRLDSGSGLCSGSVQIWDGFWTGVCDGDLDQRGAEVLCRELDCGAPSLLQGALSPLGQTFHCEGHESALMDCPRSNSSTCSSGATVNLTCSEPLRLVGGASRCNGTVEVRHRGEWRRLHETFTLWDQELTAAVCRALDCGSVVYGKERLDFPWSPVWNVSSKCMKKSSVRGCVYGSFSSSWGVDVMCSDSVRLVSGSGLCSGSVQIWDGSWTGVCDGDLGQRGAEVLCRELGCGAPSLLQGALSPLGQTFHCEGHESALMDCPRSNSSTCSSGATVNLTCSDPIRLVGGASRCNGTLEVKYEGEWRRVFEHFRLWGHEDTAAVCRDLDCGSAVNEESRDDFPQNPVWLVTPECVKESSVRECVYGSVSSSGGVNVMCSESVRLVSGSGLCSGSVQIWNGSWTGVCDGDLDQRGAEVLCRELGCGAPSLLQGALSPLGQTFHCEGHESALMDCPRSNSRTCSSGATVNLTCSEPLRLVGGASRCNGTLEVKHRGEWRPVSYSPLVWDQDDTAAVCRDLNCGSGLYGGRRSDEDLNLEAKPVWELTPDCVKKSSVRGCVSQSEHSRWSVEMMCSDSVRLVSGSGLCSGSVQIWNGSWTGVCDGDLDQRGAEVLCRELGCGAPSLLQGALSPLGQTFHCEGHESALMDCPRSNSSTCSSGATVNLTCSEPIRLVGGASRCAGILEMKLRGEWRRVSVPNNDFEQEDTAVVCRDLNCGFAVRGDSRDDFPKSPVWKTRISCVRNSSVRRCVIPSSSSSSSWGVDVECSEAASGRGSSRE